MIRRDMAAAALLAAGTAGLCMLATPFFGHPASWMIAVAGAFLGGLAAISVVVAWRAYRHHRLALRLRAVGRPTVIAGIKVMKLSSSNGAFVAGVRRPEIFCSSALPARLSDDEMRAVLLHERFHQLDQAPAKLIMLEALAPALNLFAAGRAWLAQRIAALEIAADRYSLAGGSSRSSLARALVKLANGTDDAVGIGFASAAELRIRALLGEERDAPADTSLVWLLGPVILAIACVLLVAPS